MNQHLHYLCDTQNKMTVHFVKQQHVDIHAKERGALFNAWNEEFTHLPAFDLDYVLTHNSSDST